MFKDDECKNKKKKQRFIIRREKRREFVNSAIPAKLSGLNKIIILKY